mmetsp:Transcript_16906/g.59058  ORF Transcript_16906/g.59058 Transcript_16906/m.59058 type:complete len:508 (+) Transcript_16906:83-1606(+)
MADPEPSAQDSLPSYLRDTACARHREDEKKLYRRHSSGVQSEDGPGALAAATPRGTVDLGDLANLKFKTMRASLSCVAHSIDALTNVPLFKDCSKDFINLLSEHVRNKVYCSGETILKQGDFGDSMYMMIRGEVEVVCGDVVVATLGNGAVFGEMAAMSKDPMSARRTATVRALCFVDCRVITRDQLLSTLSHFPREARIIEKKRQRRMAELQDRGVLAKAEERSWCRPMEVSQPDGGSNGKRAWRRATLVLQSVNLLARQEGEVVARSHSCMEICSPRGSGADESQSSSEHPDDAYTITIEGPGKMQPVWSTDALLLFSRHDADSRANSKESIFSLEPVSDVSPSARSASSAASSAPRKGRASEGTKNDPATPPGPLDFTSGKVRPPLLVSLGGAAAPPPAQLSPFPTPWQSMGEPSPPTPSPRSASKPRRLEPLVASGSASPHAEQLAHSAARRVSCIPSKGKLEIDRLVKPTAAHSTRCSEAASQLRSLEQRGTLNIAPGSTFR